MSLMTGTFNNFAATTLQIFRDSFIPKYNNNSKRFSALRNDILNESKWQVIPSCMAFTN